MKSTFGIIISIISLFIFYSIGDAYANSKTREILDIIEVAKQNDVKITSWSIYIKKPVVEVKNENEMKRKIKKIKRENKGYSWDTVHIEGDHHYLVVGTKLSGMTNIKERISITSYQNKDQHHLFQTLEIRGAEWKYNDWERIYSLYGQDIHKNSVFYTIKGTNEQSLTMTLQEKADKFIKDFSGEYIEGLNEKDFVSISAFTNNWEFNVPSGNGKVMNLQIGIRNNDRDKTIDVTIGTPIIVKEY